MRAANPESTRKYIAICDRDLPPAEQTVFLLTDPTVEEEAYIDDALGSMRNGGFDVRLGTQGVIALDLCLAGVENLPDDKGNMVKLERDASLHYLVGKKRPWKKSGASGLSQIRSEVRKELAQEIINGKKLTEAEEKNS